MKLVYFAWVRERVGLAQEDVDLPPGLATAGDVIAHLVSRGENYAHAFETAKSIRVAIDKMHVKHDAPVAGAREIAFFPPMTGG